ncbi:putative RNA uridine N3 methyltransferase [Methanobrevibacter boviskoreani]|uniref:putative RNA uridine N3 methyltransferase n=1 Tax=Methanobrevibacter boviskoreani TaxID=1348249 RepID=UPI0023F205F8|nr:putative RNA uridine N3 methyltransferase [Methanobrevibacter boviskoreani]MDD6256404.1 putative RNA uridine N3 methyltransferase [Methanobrevibacter boviskoreani]
MQNINLFIPNSFLAETNDLKLKTYKVGIIGRALAVFRVNKVIIYNDSSFNDERGRKDAKFIYDVLSYMNTPQYLRKRAFPIQEDLKHVGILPPLRTPHHPTNDSPKKGDFRQGFTVKRNKKGTFVDIGMDKLAFCKEQLTVNKIFSFKITKIAKEILVTPDEPEDIYWGYKTVYDNDGLKKSLNKQNPDFVVITTRYADTINSIFDELRYKVNNVNNIAIVFGGPYSSVEGNYSDPKWESIEVNTIPNQGTKTVRTEEAVVATLSLFNLLLA